MSNETEENYTSNVNLNSLEQNVVGNSIWITGIVLSTICLVLQLVLFKILPKIRKLDQKILIQLTVARLLNTTIEYLMSHMLYNVYTRDIIFGLYMQTDAVLLCWMFIFTKNLYDKVVLVFVLQKWNFVYLCLLFWLGTIPVGVLCPVFLKLDYFIEYYQAIAWLKFIILTVNILFFCKIFYVIINKMQNSNRNFAAVIKTCIISFILVCITSIQVFVTDILSYIETDDNIMDYFCIVNSFQVIAVTIIFLILAKNCINKVASHN